MTTTARRIGKPCCFGSTAFRQSNFSTRTTVASMLDAAGVPDQPRGGTARTVRMAVIFMIALAGTANAADTDSDIGKDGDIAAGMARIAISQVLNGWAWRADLGNFNGAASLFSRGGKLSLYYNDTSAQPQKITPTGRSAAPSATGGGEGGGCTAQGRVAIANFLQGRGPTYGPATLTIYPSPAQRTTLDDTVIKVGADRRTATARSYITPAPPGWDNSQQLESPTRGRRLQKQGSDNPLGGLLWTQLVKDRKTGWQIVDMKIIFNVAQPAYPCRN